MVILTNKTLRTAHIAMDMTTIADILKVDSSTVKRRLPYWEDKDYILSQAEWIKSNRGTNNFKKQ
jgi:DNA-binding MarR family transcriptional regulator